MPNPISFGTSHSIESSTFSVSAMIELLENYYGFDVASCHLLRSGFNDTYTVKLKTGTRIVARLSGRIYRGKSNRNYEASFLSYLANHGVCVAEPIRQKNGEWYCDIAAPEGARSLSVFNHLNGTYPETDEETGSVGSELAKVHHEGRNFVPPGGTFSLDAAHLIRQPFARIRALPHLESDLINRIERLCDTLALRIDNGGLTTANCHGDCHGGNSYIDVSKESQRARAWLFDFDDGGPGPLAYDLAVYLWGLLLAKRATHLDGEGCKFWRSFIDGYRSVAEINATDWAGITEMVPVRHLWFLGEYAGRTAAKGTQAITRNWFARMIDLLEKWMSLSTPEIGDIASHPRGIRANYR